MENPWTLSAQHSGAIDHLHSFSFNSSVVHVFKEIRLTVTVIVVGWVAVATIRSLQTSFSKDRGGGL